MRKQKKLVPKRRFEEFKDTNDWERRKFSELVSRVSTSNNGEGLPRVEFEDIVSGLGQLNKDIFQKESDKKGIEFKPGDTLFGKLRPYLKNWLMPDFQGIAVGDFWVLRPTDMDSKFIYSLIQSNKYQTVANLSTGTKMPRSDWGVVSNTEFQVPLNVEEQTKIGDFFKRLDKTIALHQSKLEKMKALKSACLSEMFPAEGECEPKRRFAGFTKAWELRKLGEVSPLRGGYAFQSSNFKISGIPVVRISNILSNGEVGGEYAYYEEQLDDSKYTLPDGAALLAMSGATTGKVSILKNSKNNKMYQNQRVGYFSDLNIIDYTFISIITRSQLFTNQLKSVLVAGAQPNISSKDVDDFEFYFPTDKEEQTKIGNFFKEFDDIIALHQRKLEKLQNIKKAYLNEMFV